MPFFDLPLDQLEAYRPTPAEPADFDEFWSRTLTASRGAGSEITRKRIESPLASVDVYDVTFPGFVGEPVAAWLLVPCGAGSDLPAVVTYLGYGSGRGLPHEHLTWPSAGYVHLVMDTRGQGSAVGAGGVTADPHGSAPAVPGFVTRGILEPEGYYYRRVFTDAVRAVDALRELPEVDADRIVVSGGSQGGAIALAAGALASPVAAVLTDVPFLSHFTRAVGLAGGGPYSEVVRYLSVHRDHEEQVFRTLAYFDGLSFARRANAPALYSVALMDPICPPSTVYASRNLYGGPADIVVYRFNQHEGGASAQWPRQAQWLRALLGTAPDARR